ncbi:hypothetical protein BIW11_04115 [Tropilaelaps mercedesae]|uniref:Uncharacterized protein n=1 Tax=Tropilaelaps mercedesae TaxID=418985 RepID=A0A1V9XB56_9ACAR|nr:hypothetical protein BIW11_04115 [Tropilaelaps mercedesae]
MRTALVALSVAYFTQDRGPTSAEDPRVRSPANNQMRRFPAPCLVKLPRAVASHYCHFRGAPRNSFTRLLLTERRGRLRWRDIQRGEIIERRHRNSLGDLSSYRVRIVTGLICHAVHGFRDEESGRGSTPVPPWDGHF